MLLASTPRLKKTIKLHSRRSIPVPPKKTSPSARVLDRANFVQGSTFDVEKVAIRIVVLAQFICERKFYPYQVELGIRIVTSVLNHDGLVITALMSRQVGKTEVIGAICAALAIVLPVLAKQFPNDWHLNITDRDGNYRGFREGIKIGIYAPRQEQAEITFDRIRRCFETKSTAKLLSESGLKMEVNNGNRCELTSGSVVMCQSASEQSKIEGATHHLVVAEEAQDISDVKMRKSLHPMTASTMGTIVKIGTATSQRCDFYNAINENKRTELITGVKNHFFYPYTICQKFNSLYKDYIEKEKSRIGEHSDEFRMSYKCEWIFERGMFVTQDVLFRKDIAQISGPFSYITWRRLPKEIAHYSLVLGIDWGRTHDSTVVTIMAVDWNNPEIDDASGLLLYRKHIVGWEEFIGDNYEDQFDEINSRFFHLPGLAKVVTDSNTCGQPMYDRIVKTIGSRVEVVPFNFQAKLKSDGYKALSGDLYSGRLTFPACPEVRSTIYFRKFVLQMLDLRKTYKQGLMQVAHPDEKDAHDDYPDALMLAAWGASTRAIGTGADFSKRNVFIN